LLLPLAFTSPQAVQELINDTADLAGVTELAKSVPLVWA
jgi:hypothetical protein